VGMDSATSENVRVMAPEPIGSHPIPEPDALFIDFRLGQVKSTGTDGATPIQMRSRRISSLKSSDSPV